MGMATVMAMAMATVMAMADGDGDGDGDGDSDDDGIGEGDGGEAGDGDDESGDGASGSEDATKEGCSCTAPSDSPGAWLALLFGLPCSADDGEEKHRTSHPVWSARLRSAITVRCGAPGADHLCSA